MRRPLPSHWLPRRPVGVAIGYSVHGTVVWVAVRGRHLIARGEVVVVERPHRQETLDAVAEHIRASLPRRAVVAVRQRRLTSDIRQRLERRLPASARRRVRDRAYRYAATAVHTLDACHPDQLCRPYTAVLPLPGPPAPFTVATDGSCRHRGLTTGRHPAGWAFVTGAGLVLAGQMLSDPRTAELEAVCQALAFYPPGAEVTILIDNLDVGVLVQECAEQAGAGEGMQPLSRRLRWATREIQDRVYSLVETRTVHTRYVKAHRGHVLNELADDLARDIARRYDRALFPDRSRWDRPDVVGQHAEPVPGR